jgi:membrane-bound lytic murein transglycosylase MltF
MKIYLALAGLLFTFACSANDASIPLLSIKGANWTSEESAYIKALHQQGSLRVATKTSSAVYTLHKDGSITGFHYSVLKEFADLARVSIDIDLVTWDEYFYKEGEDLEQAKTDSSYSFEPTLIKNIDLYVDGITALPWREKMFDIIKYVPSRQMIVSRNNNEPSTIADLNNKVCAMVKDTSMEANLETLKKKHRINIIYKNVDNFDAMDKLVSEGKADYTVYDSDRAFAALSNYSNLTIAWPISDIQMQGWGINKNNKVLKGVLEKYFKYAQDTGVLDKYWKLSYGVTFVDYLKVLNLEGAKH